MAKVLRIQHKDDGSGPWMSQHSEVRNVVDNTKIPQPLDDKGFDDKAISRLQDEKASPTKFGFKDEAQMARTFTPDHLAKLKEHGYEPSWVDAKDTWSSNHQVFFTTHEGDKSHAENQDKIKANSNYKEYSKEEIAEMNKSFSKLKEILKKTKSMAEKMKDPEFKAAALKSNKRDAENSDFKTPNPDFQGPAPTKEGSMHGEAHVLEHINGHRRLKGRAPSKTGGEDKFFNRAIDNKVKTTHIWDHNKKTWTHHKTEHTLGGLNVDGTKKAGVAEEKPKKKKVNIPVKQNVKTPLDAARKRAEAAEKPKEEAPKKKPKTIRRKVKKSEALEYALEELRKGMNNSGLGGPGSVKAGAVKPSLPKISKPTNSATPSVGKAPVSKKNPINQAQQTQNKDIKDIKMKEAQAQMVKFEKNGQWSLEKGYQTTRNFHSSSALDQIEAQKQTGPVKTFDKDSPEVKAANEALKIKNAKAKENDKVKKEDNDHIAYRDYEKDPAKSYLKDARTYAEAGDKDKAKRAIKEHKANIQTRMISPKEKVKLEKNGQWSLEKVAIGRAQEEAKALNETADAYGADSDYYTPKEQRKANQAAWDADVKADAEKKKAEKTQTEANKKIWARKEKNKPGKTLEDLKNKFHGIKQKIKKMELASDMSYDDSSDKVINGATVNQTAHRESDVNIANKQPSEVTKACKEGE